MCNCQVNILWVDSSFLLLELSNFQYMSFGFAAIQLFYMYSLFRRTKSLVVVFWLMISMVDMMKFQWSIPLSRLLSSYMVNLFLLIPSPREVGVISPCRIVGIEERTIVVPNKNRSTKGLKDRINKYTCLTTSYARLKNNLAPNVYLIDFHCIALFRAIDFRNL